MVDNVKYLNKEKTIVYVTPEGWTVPQPCETWHQERIAQWEEGRTDEWDQHKIKYDNYQEIMQYNMKLINYNQCMYDNPVDPDEFEPVSVCDLPIKPRGYYTIAEVDETVARHAQWTQNIAIWEADSTNFGTPYPVKEPVVLQRPQELPVVIPPSVLVPNTIELYVETSDTIKHVKLTEFKRLFNIEAYKPVEALSDWWSGGVESAMLINGKAQVLEFNNIQTGTIHNIHNLPQTFTIEQIKQIAAIISMKYEIQFIKYQEKKVAITNCNDDVGCLLAVEWDQ